MAEKPTAKRSLTKILTIAVLTLSRTLSTIDDRPLVFVHRFSPSHVDARANGLRDVHYSPINGTPSFISEIHIDPQTSESLVLLRVTIYNALQEPKASLIAELNLKFMWTLVDQLRVGRTGYAYVADQNGYMIAFGDTARVLKGENIAHLPVVADFLQNPNGPD